MIANPTISGVIALIMPLPPVGSMLCGDLGMELRICALPLSQRVKAFVTPHAQLPLPL